MFTDLQCCCSSPDIRETIQINTFCGDELASKFESLQTNPVDLYISPKQAARKALKVHNSHEKKSRSGVGLDFGLRSIDAEYERDKPADEYGHGLSKYVHKRTRMPRAVLTISKSQVPSDFSISELRKQLELLCKLDHPNIVCFRECFEDATHLKLVYDWCHGGPMMTKFEEVEDNLTEGQVAEISKEVLAALSAAHSFGVHHLDLGLYSILLAGPKLTPAKVFGLGLAGFFIPSLYSRKTSRSNKHFYAAPEVLSMRAKNLTPTQRHVSDMWSLGAILYTICSGRPPFGVGDKSEVLEAAERGCFNFGIEFSQYSPPLKGFIESLLRQPWQARATAKPSLLHPWISGQTKIEADASITLEALQDLNKFASRDHVTQTLSRLLTDVGIDDDQYPDLVEKFRELDLDGDGAIGCGEFMNVASSAGITEEQVTNIVKTLDRNGNNSVDISEFIAASVLERSSADEGLIRKAFKKLDRHHEGRLSKQDMFEVLRQYSGSVSLKQVSDFTKQTDQDGDHKIDYHDFRSLFHQVRDEKHEQVNAHVKITQDRIALGPRCLQDFKDLCAPWLASFTKQVDVISIACGAKTLPEEDCPERWSYDRGHFSEFEILKFILDLKAAIEKVPGYHLTKFMRQTRKMKDSRTNRKEPVKIIGAKTLSAEKKKKYDALEQEEGYESAGSALADTSGDEMTTARTQTTARTSRTTASARGRRSKAHGFMTWTHKVAEDRSERKEDPEYCPEEQTRENLYFLFKVKSDTYWQQPLQELHDDLLEACVDEKIDLVIENKNDLSKLVGLLNPNYSVREDIEFGETKARKVFLPKHARMVPMASMEGKSLHDSIHLEVMESMKIPVHFIFAAAKEVVTDLMTSKMKSVYVNGMHKVVQHVSGVQQNISDFFREAEEDLFMACSLEGHLPSPPVASDLFLKHCDGRELQPDAMTPRGHENGQHHEAADGSEVMQSSTPIGRSQATASFETPASKQTGEKIERYHVLNKVHAQAAKR